MQNLIKPRPTHAPPENQKSKPKPPAQSQQSVKPKQLSAVAMEAFAPRPAIASPVPESKSENDTIGEISFQNRMKVRANNEVVCLFF